MSLFSSSSQYIDPKTMLKVIERALRYLPNPAPYRERLKGTVSVAPLHEQERQLRDIYLAAEQELCSVNAEICPSSAAFRAGISRAFHIDRFAASSFSILFLRPDTQLFFVFRTLFAAIAERLKFTGEDLAALLREVGEGTPFAAVTVSKSGIAWNTLEKGFASRPVGERERSILEVCGRAVRRLYQGLVKKFGQERANLAMSEIFKLFKREYGTLPVFAAVVSAVPPNVLGESQVEFYPKERLAEELRHHMRELESTNMMLAEEAHQLRESLRSLEKAKTEMQHMQQAQEEFIRTVSHQFRTPLSVIRWQSEVVAELIAKMPQDVKSKKVIEGMSGINFKAVFLVDILNRIFDMLALDSGQMVLNPRPQVLWEMIETARHDRERDAKLRGVALVFDKTEAPVEEILVDSGQLQKAIDILVANALQYSPHGSEVTIGLEKTKGENSKALIHCSVTDQGIGMSAEDLAKLFSKFYRSEAAARKSPDGAGIALYVARRLVELHGGKMWAESAGLGKGSTFHFTIPAKIPEKTAVSGT